ncbi:MAG: 1-phosphofructokinase family hexose kinase, partial [Vulcanimicrobiota bacterium]
MICTVTLNPAYDKTVLVEDLIPHEVNSIKEMRFDPGGKGINVSRVIKVLGYESLALGIIGGDTGLYIKNHLEQRGIHTNFVEVAQPTRTNLTVIDIDDPPATEFNEPGPTISTKEILEIEKTILDALNTCNFFVFAGSLPVGAPDDTYCRLIELVRNRGGIAVLDTRGQALKEGVRIKPYMIKPNQSEASELLGRKIDSVEDTARACEEFYEQGIKYPIISLGKRGAVLACSEGTFLAVPPQVQVESAVGAGDSLV